MSNKTLFQEAIADAKAVREAALANAKAALEETMTPRLQSMIAARLEENYDELEEEDFMQPLDTSDEIQQSGFGNKEQGKPGHGDSMEEELDLSAILAELEAENQLEEAKKKEDDEESEDEESEDEEGKEDEQELPKDIDELIELIKDIINQEAGSEEPSEEMPEEPSEEEGGEEVEMEKMDEEFDLEELLAELDALGEDEDMEKESMYEAKKKSKHEKGETKTQEKAEHASGKEKAEKSEMKEALSVINTLRNELNEVNLLNAKLLYVNKIFKSKNLTENQKVQVIASFDKASTIKEAKVVFESLSTALTPAKKQIKESIGFASKAAGIAPKQQIVESNDTIARMQKLANIIK